MVPQGQEVALLFRLDLPHKPQLLRAERILRNLAKVAGPAPKQRHNPRAYRDFLRILDARACNLSFTTIATSWSSSDTSNERALSRLHAGAQLLVDGGWRQLLLTGTKRTLRSVR